MRKGAFKNMASVNDFIQQSFAICFGTGFAAGFLVCAFIVGIRAIVSIFHRIVGSRIDNPYQ